MKVTRYQQSLKTTWDAFVRASKNGTFLLMRDYVDYHADRFEDCSLMMWDDKDKLLAVLPAHKTGEHFSTHKGLTYGGLIVDSTMTTTVFIHLFEQLLSYLLEEGFKTLYYKTVPYIYHDVPAEEDRYALFIAKAHVVKRSVLTVIDNRQVLKFQERRRRGIKKAMKHELTVCLSEDYSTYWQLLSELLASKFQSEPVHSLAEIESLQQHFPGHIKLYACFDGATMLAGVLVYESENVVRAQYIASNDQGKRLGALDLIFNTLVTEIYCNKRFFEFGASDHDVMSLNAGLVNQKEGFGARVVVQDHYVLDLDQSLLKAFEGVLQ